LILAWIFPFPLVGGLQVAIEARLVVDGQAEKFLDGIGRVEDLASDMRIYVWFLVLVVLIIADYFNQGWFRQRADKQPPQPLQPRRSGDIPQSLPVSGNIQEVDFGGPTVAITAVSLGFLVVVAVFLLTPLS
jgi:hypothetical protein